MVLQDAERYRTVHEVSKRPIFPHTEIKYISCHDFFLRGDAALVEAAFFGLAAGLSALPTPARAADASALFALLGDATVAAVFFTLAFLGLPLPSFVVPWSVELGAVGTCETGSAAVAWRSFFQSMSTCRIYWTMDRVINKQPTLAKATSEHTHLGTRLDNVVGGVQVVFGKVVRVLVVLIL